MKSTTATNLFASAKKTEPKSAAKKDKDVVQITGLKDDLLRYVELKKQEENIKAEKEMIGGRIKEKGKAKFLDKYEKQKSRPESFHIADDEGKILFLVMDAYKKLTPEKVEALQGFDNVVETTTTYTINADVLERCGEAVSKAIVNSKEISAEDKANLILATEETRIKKGTIDRLCLYPDPAHLFYLIEPTCALK